jgi:hypothetical protein|tara:strand:- start:142 stop:441 length:300 start_codon:yes stop_codon:yes gene_type:complete
MSSRDIAPPRLPQPNGELTVDYMYDLVTTLDFFIQQQQNPGEGRNTKLVFTALPTSDVGLEEGTLYRVGNDVKVSLLNIAGVDGNSVTATLGSVTVSVS